MDDMLLSPTSHIQVPELLAVCSTGPVTELEPQEMTLSAWACEQTLKGRSHRACVGTEKQLYGTKVQLFFSLAASL